MYRAILRNVGRDTVKECWPPPSGDASASLTDGSHDKKLSSEDQKHDETINAEVETPFKVVAAAKPLERTSQPHFAKFVRRDSKLEVQCSPGLKPGIEAILNDCHGALSRFGEDCGEYLQGASAEDVLDRLDETLREFHGITRGAHSASVNDTVSRTAGKASVEQSSLTYLSTGQQLHYIVPQSARGAFIVYEEDQPTAIVPAGSSSISKQAYTTWEPPYVRMYFKINDSESLCRFYRAKCNELQVKALKTILKIIIKCIVDKKQSKYPYNGGKLARTLGSARAKSSNGRLLVRGELTRPPWWPEHVRHKEPDHLKKEELHDLFTFFMEALGSKAVEKEKGKVTVAKLEEEIAKASESLTEQKHDWREIVVSILAVRKRKQEIEDEVTDCIRMMQPEVSRQALLDTFPQVEEKDKAASSLYKTAEDPLKEIDEEDIDAIADASDLGDPTAMERVVPTIEDAHGFHKMPTAPLQSDGMGFSRVAQDDRELSHDSSKTKELTPCKDNSSFEHMLLGNYSYGSYQHTLPADDFTSASFVGSSQLADSSMPTDLGIDTPVPAGLINIPFVVAPQLPNAAMPDDLGIIPPVDQASLMSTMILSGTPIQSPQVKKRKRVLDDETEYAEEMPTSSQESFVQPAVDKFEDQDPFSVQPNGYSLPSFVTHNVLANHAPALRLLAPTWLPSYEAYTSQSQLATQSFFGIDANTYNPWSTLTLNQTFPPYSGGYGMVAAGPNIDSGFNGPLIRPMTSHMMRPLRPQGSLEFYSGQGTGTFDPFAGTGNVSPLDKSFPSKRRCDR